MLHDVFLVQMYLFSCNTFVPQAVALHMVCDGEVDCPNAADEKSAFCAGLTYAHSVCMFVYTCVVC